MSGMCDQCRDKAEEKIKKFISDYPQSQFKECMFKHLQLIVASNDFSVFERHDRVALLQLYKDVVDLTEALNVLYVLP